MVILRKLWKGRSANDAGKTGGVSGSNRTITFARTHVAMGTRGLYTDHGEIRSMEIRVRGGSCGELQSPGPATMDDPLKCAELGTNNRGN